MESLATPGRVGGLAESKGYVVQAGQGEQDEPTFTLEGAAILGRGHWENLEMLWF